MNEASHVEAALGSSRKRWSFILSGMAALALVVGLSVARRTAERRERAELEKHYAAIRAAGNPVTGRELLASWPEPAPGRDFALKVDSVLKTLPLESGIWSAALAQVRTQAVDAALLAQLQRAAVSNAPVLDVVLRTDCSLLAYGSGGMTNPNSIMTWKVPEFFPSIDLNRALGLKALQEAATGHPDTAAIALVRSFEVAHVRRLWLIGAVGQEACEAISFRSLQAVMRRCPLEEAGLRRLERALPRRTTNTLAAAVVEERIFEINACEMARDFPDRFMAIMRLPGAAPATGGFLTRVRVWASDWVAQFREPLYRHKDFVALLEAQARLEAASRLPPPERLAEFQRWGNPQWLPGSPSQISQAVRLIVPKWTAFATEDAMNQSRLVVARTALAVERWRLAHEAQVPASLAELVPAFLPAVPTDPFDGRPIRFKRLPKGYKIYSVGPDSTDNGGTEPGEGATGDGQQTDVTFTVER